jgi:hypothetical protein
VGGEPADVIRDIEDAFVAQWSHFGRWPGGELHDEHGVLRTETPIKHLPYNAVLRTRLETDDVDAVLEGIIARYRERDVAFMWLDHPTASPNDLGRRLRKLGLEPVEAATGMSLGLENWAPTPSTVRVAEVASTEDLAAYADIIMRYWEIPPADQEMVRELNLHWSGQRAPGHRYLAFDDDGTPIGKGYLSLAGPPGRRRDLRDERPAGSARPGRRRRDHHNDGQSCEGGRLRARGPALIRSRRRGCTVAPDSPSGAG